MCYQNHWFQHGVLKMALAMLVSKFSECCESENKCTVEQVEIIDEANTESSCKLPASEECELKVKFKLKSMNSLFDLNLGIEGTLEVAM